MNGKSVLVPISFIGTVISLLGMAIGYGELKGSVAANKERIAELKIDFATQLSEAKASINAQIVTVLTANAQDREADRQFRETMIRDMATVKMNVEFLTTAIKSQEQKK